jgi:hypothetical protein
LQPRGTKRKKESDRLRRRQEKAEAAAERKAARDRAIELGLITPGSGPEMGEPQPPLDPGLVRSR